MRNSLLCLPFILLFACPTSYASQLEAPLRLIEQSSPDNRNLVSSQATERLDFRNIKPAEEVGTLKTYLQSKDRYMRRTATVMVNLVLIYHRDADTLHAFRSLAPEMQTLFNDTDPDAMIVDPHAPKSPDKGFWKDNVMLYIEVVGVQPERQVLLGMEAAMQDDDDMKISRRAIETLASLKPLPKEVLDALLAKTHDNSGQGARGAVLAAFALWRVGEPAAVQEMTAALESEVPYERYAAARGLARLEASQIRGAEPVLQKLVATTPPGEDAYQEAMRALAKIKAAK